MGSSSSNPKDNFNITYIDCPITPQQQQCLQMSFSVFIKNQMHNSNKQGKEILSICNHPALYKQYHSLHIHHTRNDFDKNESGKMIILQKLLEKLKKSDKKIIISAENFEIFEIISNFLIIKGYQFAKLECNIRGINRQKAIDIYNSTKGFFIFLTSINSGLVGINLSLTDCVIIFNDNRSVNSIIANLTENGIGKTKKVKIYRLVTTKSYEQIMINYLDRNKNQNIEKFLRFGAFYAFKDCINPIFNEDIDFIISHSSKNDDANSFDIADIESPDFWMKQISTKFYNNNFYNPGNSSFKESIQSKIFVDKSEMIYHINKLIGTEQKCICVTRPRRFGKTMAAKMLYSYYSKGCDSSKLFDGLKISKMEGYNDHLNNHNVIFIDMQLFTSIYNGNPIDIFSFIQKSVLDEIKLYFPDIKNDSLILALGETNQSFIIIIDEWDVIYNKYSKNREVQSKYIDFLVSLSKAIIAKNPIELVYMTGILPIKKHDIYSSLNNFTECSMLNPTFMSSYTGFTEDEVRDICDKNDFSFNEMRIWYDGYILNEIHIYNPKSIVDAILSEKIDNHWSKTGSLASLKEYIDMNFDGLRDEIIHLIANEHVKVDFGSFQNDLDDIKSKDDVNTILVHLGYLAFDQVNSEVFIPNQELLSVFGKTVKNCNWPIISDALKKSDDLLKATLDMNGPEVANIIGQIHYSLSSSITYNNENSLSCVIINAYYTARRFYSIIREHPLGHGYADFVFIPRHGINKPAILFELKWNKNANTAITQIKEKKYSEHLSDYIDNIIIVAISYNKSTKKHECEIYKYKKT